jgi:predicted RecA/RadA family phage recombinase
MMPGNDFATNQAGSLYCTAAERVAGGLWSLNSSTGAFTIPQSVTTNCTDGNVIGFKFKVVDLANDASGRIYATRDVAFSLKTTTNCAPTIDIDGTTDGSTLTLSVDTTTVVTVTATDDTSGSCDAATAVTLTIAGAPTWATVSAQESISGVSSNVRRTITLTPTNSNGIGTSRLISISATDSGSPNLGQRASFTARVPSNPPTGIAGDTQVTLSWAAVSISGETVTYKIQQSTDGGSNFTDVSGASNLTETTHEITGLTNGQAYNFRVIAIGSISGAQAPGDYSEALTPFAITVPNAPTIDSISAFNSELRIFFTAGTNGGSSITDYEYSIDNGSTWISSGSTSSPITISGLTNGTSYQIKLRAVNTAGSGNASLAVSATPLLPASTPQPPAPATTPDPTPTPSSTPTASPTPTRTPLATATIQPTPPANPLPSPTPTPTTQSTPQSGSPLNPAPLIQRTIEEIVDALKPVAFDALVNLITRAIEEIRSGVTQSTLVLLLSKDDADKLVSGDNKIILDTPTSVMKDGVAEPARIVVVDITQLQVVAGEGGLLKLEAKDGEDSVPVDSQGRLQMLRDNLVEAEGTGFAANSEFAVWLFSDPTMLGIGKTDAAGRFFASFPVEKDIPLGDHTLQVVGVTSSGEQRSISLPVIVLDNKEAAMNNSIENMIEVSQNPLQGWFDSINYLFLLLILLFLIGIWAIWVSRREYRERKKELELREAELNPFVAPRPEFQAEKAAVLVAAAARRKDDTDEIDVEAVKAEIKKNAPKKTVAKKVKPRKKSVSKK